MNRHGPPGTPKHDPADLAKLINLLAQHEQSHHDGKPFDLKRAIALVEELAEDREALWGRIEKADAIDAAAYKTPEDLAEMWHEARCGRLRELDMTPIEWGDLAVGQRDLNLRTASDVIDRLLRGDS